LARRLPIPGTGESGIAASGHPRPDPIPRLTR